MLPIALVLASASIDGHEPLADIQPGAIPGWNDAIEALIRLGLAIRTSPTEINLSSDGLNAHQQAVYDFKHREAS
jgi:hypothetical protein